MNRYNIIETIGSSYLTSNIENNEFSYVQAFRNKGMDLPDFAYDSETRHTYRTPDIRFANERLVIIVDTKRRFATWDKNKIFKQLQTYVRLEKALSDKKIVAILAETEGDQIWVWYGQSVIIDDSHRKRNEKVLHPFKSYEDIYFGKINDKIRIVDSINELNKMLNSDGIDEKLRSQFVGTCLLALKYHVSYKDVKESIDPETGNPLPPEKIVLSGIKNILKGLLKQSEEENDNTSKANITEKVRLLNDYVLDSECVQRLTYEELKSILVYIDDNVLPYINDETTAGQDLLSLFFTTFNKFVGKADKNQAFTPDHICDFMSKAVGVNKNSRVLDPCCGSGAFLVRAMTDAMDNCDTELERTNVKKNQIFGIEYEEGAFGLASTNMLIHGDGNSNIIHNSMFECADWIKSKNINVVLMNPPYDATKKCCNPAFVSKWKPNQKTDPSEGFHYVEWIAECVAPYCKMAVLLPTQCAIGSKCQEIKDFKRIMLDKYTLDAVFSLPTDVFYPGASAVVVCMIFDLSHKHEDSHRETFFGYYRDDKFEKRKGRGRVEMVDQNGKSLWEETEQKWLDLYRNRKSCPGLSVTHYVTAEDEWLAEAYMETDYSQINDKDFKKTLDDYLGYLVKEGLLNSDD